MYRGTDAYTHADRHADAYTNGNADPDTNSVSDGNANAHRNADAQPDPDTYAGRDLHADAHRYRGVCGQFGRVPIDHGRPGIGDRGYGRLRDGAAELLGGKRDERECVDPGIPVQHDKPSYGHIYEANPTQPTDFTLRAGSRTQVVMIRAQCGAATASSAAGWRVPDLTFWIPANSLAGGAGSTAKLWRRTSSL